MEWTQTDQGHDSSNAHRVAWTQRQIFFFSAGILLAIFWVFRILTSPIDGWIVGPILGLVAAVFIAVGTYLAATRRKS